MNLNDVRLRFRAILHRDKMESELEEEIRSHLDLQTQKYAQKGMSAKEARRAAHRDFGALQRTKEECRDERRVSLWSDLQQDLRYAVRMFRRSPGITGLIVFMLAIGIGGNLSTFRVSDALLFRPLPVHDPRSLFRTVNTNGGLYDSSNGCSLGLYEEMRRRTGQLCSLMAYHPAETALVSVGSGEAERLTHQTASGNYFTVLGVRPIAGRVLSPEDDGTPGRHPVAVISDRLWKSKFDRSIRALGNKLRWNDQVFDIVGVAPAEFFGVEVGQMVDVWTPISMAPIALLQDPHTFWLRVMGRVRPGVTITQANAPIQAVMNEAMLDDVRQHALAGTPKAVIDQFLAGMRIKGISAAAGISSLGKQYQQPLKIMMFIVAFVMAITCANVGGLLIAKGSARRQEIAIRLSLGAARVRILKQLVTESLLLAALSLMAGLLISRWTTPLLVRLLRPSTAPARLAAGIDLRTMSFSISIALTIVLVCGLLPALRLTKVDSPSSLKSGAWVTGGIGGIGKSLMAAQIAMSFILVIGAGLFLRTLINLVSSPLGFNPANILVTRMALAQAGDQRLVYSAWNNLLREVRALPRVRDASLSSAGLFAGQPQMVGIRPATAAGQPSDPLTGVLFVSNGYFQTMRIRLVSGRDLASHDDEASSPSVALVNRAFVRKFIADADPIGRKFTKMANSPVWTEIAGVVEDTKYNDLRENPPPMIYVPYGKIAEWIRPDSHPDLSMFLQVQGYRGRAMFSAELRNIAGQRFSVEDVNSQQQLVDDTLVRERLLANVAGIFACLAVVLAAMGLYGIISYVTAGRRREFAIRTALGAAPRALWHLALSDAFGMVAVGTVVGIVAAPFGIRLAKSLLFGLAPSDPSTFAIAALILFVSSLTAAFIPAYKAAKADPMVSLRDE
jgi:predicted permease